MKYKWIFVKNDKGEYKKIKCFVLEEKKVEKPKYKIIKKPSTFSLKLNKQTQKTL